MGGSCGRWWRCLCGDCIGLVARRGLELAGWEGCLEGRGSLGRSLWKGNVLCPDMQRIVVMIMAEGEKMAASGWSSWKCGVDLSIEVGLDLMS